MKSVVPLGGSRSASPRNEPVLDFAPGSNERAALKAELARQSAEVLDLPLVIGGREERPGTPETVTAPHRHSLVIGRRFAAEPAHVERAIQAALEAKRDWAARTLEERAAVFLRAADLLAGPRRSKLLAATMLNQSKTPYQAEIDAACELADFLRFNVHFARSIEAASLISPEGVQNTWDHRPLDGFVLAVTPFNFTAIAGNLPTAPALMGNTVVWKPSPLAALSGYHLYTLLKEAGLPDGVINLVQGDASSIVEQVVGHRDFSGLHFTGSTAVLRHLHLSIASHLPRYRSYPRIVGESGGKDFVFAHPSADPETLAVALMRGAYEYQGQKCSAASRAYVPRSLWPQVRERMLAMLARAKVGDPADFSCFMGAVIGRAAFDRIRRYQALAKGDSACRVLFGGGADDREGFFVEPTLVELSDPEHALMREEIFGPLLAVYVYEDERFDEAVSLCEGSSDYALTGAVFAGDEAVVSDLAARLRFAAGNFYVNDKPTGAVVGQQPFGGSRLSGTNDKAGSEQMLLRWSSPRVIKRNWRPPRDFSYPHMSEGD
jgi:1-pyrroline-5-carboxylate dehydrogenase